MKRRNATSTAAKELSRLVVVEEKKIMLLDVDATSVKIIRNSFRSRAIHLFTNRIVLIFKQNVGPGPDVTEGVISLGVVFEY
jgi:hypothetical protein